MPKMSVSEIRALLAAEKADALASVNASKLSQSRADAMDYYNGDMSAHMPTQPGRSSAVSSDVSDTIDGLLPGLLEIFCGGDEVVQFAPVGPEDVKQAEQETDYVNHVFMNQNPGFMILYTFMKDALLSKVGVVKIWTEEEEEYEEETYLNQTGDALAVMAQDPDIEIVEHTPMPGDVHDVKVRKTKKCKRHIVEPVPPEEFGISRNAKSVKDATYTFHETRTTVGDLIDRGYDEDQVMALPSETEFSDNNEVQTRDTVDESTASSNSDTMNKRQRLVVVTEHYLKADIDGKGESCINKIMTGGSQCEVLNRKGKPDIEEVEYAPFAAMTPSPMPHRFFGKSVADMVMDIQRIKTALVRGMLDNLYLHNNPRVEVAKSHANENTLDDLMISRIGGVVRTAQPGGVAWQVVPDITASLYPALQYFDATREWRTGVTRQGQGIDAEALQNQSATAVNQVMSAAQARMKMIARVFAETGIRDLFSLLHAQIRRHGDQAETVRLRNQWVPVDPRQWKHRKDLTINVGLGSGNKQERIAGLNMLIMLQKEALLAGKTNLVSDAGLYNSAKEMAKLLDYRDPEQFFLDPTATNEMGQLKNPPPPPQPSPEMLKVQIEQQKAQAEIQLKQADIHMRGQELQAKAAMDAQADQRKAEIERFQAEADIATNDRKIAADIALAERKFELEAELKRMEFALEQHRTAADIEMKREAHGLQMQSNVAKTAMDQQSHDHKMEEAKTVLAEKKKAKDGSDKKDANEGKMAASIEALAKAVALKDNNNDAMSASIKALADAVAKGNSPRKISKGSDGSYRSELE
jgi:hypothetical protein